MMTTKTFTPAVRFFQTLVMAMAIVLSMTLLSNTAMAADKINLNQADAETLQYIPGIGPSKSIKIIEVRDQRGGFDTMEQLLEVPGIGAKTLISIKKYGSLEGGVSKLTDEMKQNPPKQVSAVTQKTDTTG